MKTANSLVLLLAFVHLCARAQNISLSTTQLEFDTLIVNVRDSLSFCIRNNGTDTLHVHDVNPGKAAFSVRDTTFTVLPNDSATVWVYFQTNQNVTWTDVLLIENTGANGTIPLRVRGTARFSGTYYNSTQGLWENDLKNALLNLVNNHTVLGYNIARDRMFETIDDPAGIDTIECVYTGRRIRAVNRTEAQNQGFNTEHSWPQSTFGSLDPMQSDINHLFPVDEEANSARSNYPFAPVVSNIMWQNGGSKLGFNPNGLISFEPRDVHKGDVARVMFYFLLRYPNNYGNFMDAIQEFYLRQWYNSDPVSAKELQRTTAIALFQGKRNPLVDHPEFVERISYFRSTTPPPVNPTIIMSPAAIDFGTISSGDSIQWQLTAVDNGRGILNISSIALQNPSPNFVVVDQPTTIPPDSFVQTRIRFKPDQPNQTFTNAIVIQSNDPARPTVTVPLSGNSSGATSTTHGNQPYAFVLHQNYPNPFNPRTTIRFEVSSSEFVELKIVDLLGQEVADLVKEVKPPGEYTATWDASGVGSGVYIYQLRAGNFVDTKRLIVLK
ncbi:MAG: endonuclease [Ignavibacteriae bacterium]|nr:endonuclease [Ignavibacteriota bacterium]